MPPLPQLVGAHQFTVRVVGVADEWRTAEPPAYTAETREEYDGGSQGSVVISGRPKWDTLEVTRGWDHRREPGLLARLRREVAAHADRDVVIQPIEGDPPVPVGRPDTYRGRVQSIARSGVNANSEDTAMITLTIHVYRAS